MTSQQKEGYTLQELLQKYQVEIPMLQRDYAQGRRSSESIAKEFLNAIFEVLEGRKGTLHIDFIFGYQENNKFLLIDGQQRITTLWLLHFYLYKKSGVLKDKKSLLGNFSYSVRRSSRDFCKNLLKKDFDISKKPSEAIIDAGSEFGEAENLRNDPTIKAMLHMLDLIYEKIEDKDKNSIQKLAESLNSITFELFDMGKFSLGDELYIKMNARGKQLSRYENLKAFIQKDSKISCDRELLENMDSKWTDYFFEVEKLKEFDTRGRNFLHYAALFFYFKNKDSITDEERIKKSDQPIDDFYQSLQKIENIKLLDRAIELFLCFNDLGINEKLAPQESSFFIKKDEDESEDKDKSEGLSLRKICYFFSILSFLEKNRENDFNDIKNHLNDWLRVSRHLIENHRLDKPGENLSAFSGLFKYLSEGHDDIYQFLVDHPSYKFHSNFYSLESRKAKLILKSRSGEENWEGILNQTSEHPILKGWVDFLLDFSDEEFQYESYSRNKKYYQKSRPLYQSSYQHPNLEKFRQYADLTMQILDKENFLDENLGLFQRAFLCIGDYSFLSNNWFYGNYIPQGIFRDREALNWILSGVKNEKEMPYFKEFLDRLLESPKANLQDKMQEIIDHCDLSNKEWWEQLLIIQKELFEFVNAKKKVVFQRYRRIRKEESRIELLHKSRRIGPGRNLLHYGFYNYCNENKEKYNLSISEYNDEGKRNFFTLNGKELFCDDAGTETKESKITFDSNHHPIVLKNVNIFDEFKRILREIAALLIKNNS